jgi:twitching motility protein PilJ
MNEYIHKQWLNRLKVLLGIFLIFTFICFWSVSIKGGYDKQYITYAAELRVLFERFVRHAGESVNEAKVNAFTYLKYRKNEFTAIVEILKRGKVDYAGKTVLPPSPKEVQDKELLEISRIWSIEKENAEFILDNQALLVNLHNTVTTLSTPLNKIQEQYLNLISVLSKRGAAGDEYAAMSRQIYNAQQIQESINSILDSNIDIGTIERQLPKKVQEFETSLKELKAKYVRDPIYPNLVGIENEFVAIKERTNEVVETGRTLVKIFAAWSHIYAMIPRFLEATTSLEKAYSGLADNQPINNRTVFILAGITFLILGLLLYLMYRENKFNLKQSGEETVRLQEEIQKLVNEMKGLAHGNLSVNATKGVGVTAQIAEAFNYTINALRKLVTSINQTSQKVSNSAGEVKQITKDLTKAINQQSVQIVSTGASVNIMVSSIEEVSNTAKKSALVAENSVEIAHEGALIVNDTISGMERIREQIRETEKRIQRLSESTQEIGEIVSLIDGISEQTNILSLNAAIQAAMAGDVGMGFAVVADEVQQLAVKSSDAAKEVENIVKTVRTDTNRAAESMERAIAEVNLGTTLAHDAGRALEKIEIVSKDLSELIQGISKAADEQTQMSGKITKMMSVIEAIATQTATGTDTTAESIATLDALVQELNNSVSEFKLPEAAHE